MFIVVVISAAPPIPHPFCTPSVLEKMAEAIEDSEVVIVGISSAYKDSQACRTEANYAYTLKKNIVFVQAEDGYRPKGWLGALLGMCVCT